MEAVKCYMVNSRGRRPEKVQTRPRLPQAAVHCPPLTDGNQLGWMVYPNTGSRWEVERQPELMQIAHKTGGKADFDLDFVLQAFEDGSRVMQLAPTAGSTVGPAQYQRAEGAASEVFHDIQNPSGAITLLSNCWFVTPEGWDSVWMGVTNQFDPPTPHAYTVRVQTDWYTGSAAVEVRYQLRIGERLRVDGQSPIGMVVFVPRHEPLVEFLPYDGGLNAERERQVAEKYQAEHVRTRHQMSPYSVWYLGEKRS